MLCSYELCANHHTNGNFTMVVIVVRRLHHLLHRPCNYRPQSHRSLAHLLPVRQLSVRESILDLNTHYY